MKLDLEIVKQYMRVDYTDDDEIIALLLETVLDELADLIPDFERDSPTNRQKVLILTSVKELYERREKRGTPEPLQAAVSTLLLKEMYK